MYKSLPHLNESDIFYIRLRLHKKWLMAIGYVVGENTNLKYMQIQN